MNKQYQDLFQMVARNGAISAEAAMEALKEAENLLYDEISYVLKLDKLEVISMLKDKLDVDSTLSA